MSINEISNESLKFIKDTIGNMRYKVTKENKLKAKTSEKENGELTFCWEFYTKPFSNKSEKEYFISLQKYIHNIDIEIVSLAKYCEQNNIPYTFKLCKTKRLETDPSIPVLLTSYISMNFPANEYYLSKQNEDIMDSEEEFKYRIENGFYTDNNILDEINKNLD